MSKLLTKTEIARLTGAPVDNPEAQKQVLDANRVPYFRRKDGSPALTWDVVNQALLARGASTPAANGANLPPGFKLPQAS
ncbi:DUF4224 domain-containing protein [Microbulbifer sp. HZ11]|uniref:DUF4224 domain-containing protein n=1 Tax=Microbulbifer sp. HZ11 TaxID=1453501 RepID=UPI0005B9DF58|nr:DUF4224 domain-containing protein [Microbulbifer sp. HZ11]